VLGRCTALRQHQCDPCRSRDLRDASVPGL